MAAPKFSWFASFFGNTDVFTRVSHQLAPSITVLKGQALTLGANGKLALSTVAQVVDYIAMEDATSTATSRTFIKCVHAGKGLAIWKSQFTPITGATDPFCTAAGTTTTAQFLTAGGSNDDMIGSVLYFPDSDEVRKITTNTYSSLQNTATWLEPLAAATTTSTHIRASIIGIGDKLVQMEATGGGVGASVIGKKTGGKLTCYELDLKNNTAYVTFNPS